MQMRTSLLTRPVDLLRPEVKMDGYGGFDTIYTPYASVFAHIVDTKGNFSIRVRQTIKEALTVFTIRYRSDIESNDRVLWKGRQYEIIGVPVEIQRNAFLEINGKARDTSR